MHILFFIFIFGSVCFAEGSYKTSFLYNYLCSRQDISKINVGYASLKGKKKFNQDSILLPGKEPIQTDFSIGTAFYVFNKRMLFGIFDGHSDSHDPQNNGAKISLMVTQLFKRPCSLIYKFFLDLVGIQLSTLNIFNNIALFINRLPEAAEAGTTACVLESDHVRADKRIYNLGDSRALYGSGKGFYATVDHNVNNDTEWRRYVACYNALNLKKKYDLNVNKRPIRFTNPYTASGLCVSRTLGDTSFSNQFEGFISNEPEVYSIPDDCPFILIGCDGCFDYTDNSKLWDIFMGTLSEKAPMEDIVYSMVLYIIQCELPKLKETLDQHADDYQKIKNAYYLSNAIYYAIEKEYKKSVSRYKILVQQEKQLRNACLQLSLIGLSINSINRLKDQWYRLTIQLLSYKKIVYEYKNIEQKWQQAQAEYIHQDWPKEYEKLSLLYRKALKDLFKKANPDEIKCLCKQYGPELLHDNTSFVLIHIDKKNQNCFLNNKMLTGEI